MSIIERLREGVVGPALLDGRILDGALAERLIRERHAAADRIEELEAALRVVAKELPHLGDGADIGAMEIAVATTLGTTEAKT